MIVNSSLVFLGNVLKHQCLNVSHVFALVIAFLLSATQFASSDDSSADVKVDLEAEVIESLEATDDQQKLDRILRDLDEYGIRGKPDDGPIGFDLSGLSPEQKEAVLRQLDLVAGVLRTEIDLHGKTLDWLNNQSDRIEANERFTPTSKEIRLQQYDRARFGLAQHARDEPVFPWLYRAEINLRRAEHTTSDRDRSFILINFLSDGLEIPKMQFVDRDGQVVGDISTDLVLNWQSDDLRLLNIVMPLLYNFDRSLFQEVITDESQRLDKFPSTLVSVTPEQIAGVVMHTDQGLQYQPVIYTANLPIRKSTPEEVLESYDFDVFLKSQLDEHGKQPGVESALEFIWEEAGLVPIESHVERQEALAKQIEARLNQDVALRKFRKSFEAAHGRTPTRNDYQQAVRTDPHLREAFPDGFIPLQIEDIWGDEPLSVEELWLAPDADAAASPDSKTQGDGSNVDPSKPDATHVDAEGGAST